MFPFVPYNDLYMELQGVHMDNTYYTVEKISSLLQIHPKTVQRYIRQGKLPATKIGKSWRVSGHDLSIFVGASDDSIVNSSRAISQITVSSVVDIDVPDMDEAMRIANAITASMNAKPPEYGKSSLSVQFIPTESKLRLMLWGTAKFMETMMYILSQMIDDV